MGKLSILKELWYGLPLFKKEYKINSNDDARTKQILKDKRTHILATCMAAYPFTPTKQLAKEFGIQENIISALAGMYGIKKNPNVRSVINRENGMQADNSQKGIPVEKVARNGRVVAVFQSATKAAADAGASRNVIVLRCKGKIKSPLKGYRYRFKK